MFSSKVLRWTSIILSGTTSHALLIPRISNITNATNIKTPSLHNVVAQQNKIFNAPLPIIEIGLQHILSQIGANDTKAENESIATNAERYANASKVVFLNKRDSPAQCGPGQPCVDASCCNSEGKCGYTAYTCNTTAATTCISNCNAHANCGVDSLYGQQKCPLNLCCSHFGYCGTSDLHCINADPDTLTLPCQQGFGDCAVVSAPTCDPSKQAASRGRNVAYYQASNVIYRQCNRIMPSQIDTTNLTHLLFAFAVFDPISFAIIPAFPEDINLYPEFTNLHSTIMDTWISIGGFDFGDPGRTFAAWSDMTSTATNRAAFISSLMDFMRQWGFQGADLDWEFPGVAARGGNPADTANFVSLVQEMRAAFGTEFGISTTLSPDYAYLSFYDPISMQPYVNFFNFMAYDLHGPWEASVLGAFVRSQSSIIDIDLDLLPLWFDSLDPSKINLGIPYYGRGYTLSDPSCTTVGCPYLGDSLPGPCTDSAGLLSLREIDLLIQQKDLRPTLLEDEMIKEILYDTNQWIGYDDDETIALKRNWADKHCLGGVAIWSMDLNSGAGSGDVPHPVVLSPSPDGTCGSPTSFTCQGSLFGSCCSIYGYCGGTSNYCALSDGCQAGYGTCSTDVVTISTDGSCGNGVTCLGSRFLDCCSKYGICGSTPDFCYLANGCQSAWGTCVVSF